MPSDATATIHNFTLKKYSKFDHNTWIHHPYRTDLSITFIEPAHLATTKDDIVVIVYWKGSPIDKYTLIINDKVKTSILTKTPSIGIKQTVVSSGDLMFRFQISLVDDGEFDKCHEVLKRCTFQETNWSEEYKNDGVNRNVSSNYNTQFTNPNLSLIESALFLQPMASAVMGVSQSLDLDLQQLSQQTHNPLFDLQQQQPPQLLMFLQPPKSQSCLQMRSNTQCFNHFQSTSFTQSAQDCMDLQRSMQGFNYSQPTQPIQTVQPQSSYNLQLQQHTQSQLSLQQLQQQFLQWQHQNQQNLASTQLPQFIPPNPLYTQSQPAQPTPIIQNQPATQPSQSSTQIPNTSVSSIDLTPIIAINDLNDLDSLTDSQLSALITEQCHMAQFRAFVKRLDKILENKRQNMD